jgi:hypothetical protein
MYGLGSLVKSVKKAVKNVVKSPIGKAAILGFGGAGLMGLGPLGSTLGKYGLGAKSFLLGSGMGGAPGTGDFGFLGKLGLTKGYGRGLTGKGLAALGIGGASILSGLFAGKSEEEIEAIKQDPAALENYLRDYYSRRHPEAGREEVERFVRTNLFADGGRVKYQQGSQPAQQLGSSQGASPLYQNVLQYLQRGGQQAQPAAQPTAQSPAPAPFDLSKYGQGVDLSGGIEDSRSIALTNLAELGYDVDRFMDVGAPPSTSSGPQMIGPGGMMPSMKFKDQETLAKLMNPAFDFQQGDLIGVLREAKDIGRDYTIDEALKLSKEDIMEISDLYAKKHKYGKYAPVSPSSRYTGPTSFTYGGGQTGVATPTFKKGGSVVDQASGIMGLPKRTNEAGVKELDLRKSGGFIPPVGVKERADDIPAMLSNNEFVFTADAVRGMGDGDVNKGAQRMYTMMKTLEKGGRV